MESTLAVMHAPLQPWDGRKYHHGSFYGWTNKSRGSTQLTMPCPRYYKWMPGGLHFPACLALWLRERERERLRLRLRMRMAGAILSHHGPATIEGSSRQPLLMELQPQAALSHNCFTEMEASHSVTSHLPYSRNVFTGNPGPGEWVLEGFSYKLQRICTLHYSGVKIKIVARTSNVWSHQP
ncbi:unnamed protein product [Lepidochelys kempii]